MNAKRVIAALLIGLLALSCLSATAADNMPAKFKSDNGDIITIQLKESGGASLRLYDRNGKLVTVPMDFSTSAPFDWDTLSEITVLAKNGEKEMKDRMLVSTDQGGTSVATFTKSQQTNVTENNRNDHKVEVAERIKKDGYHTVLHVTKVKDQ